MPTVSGLDLDSCPCVTFNAVRGSSNWSQSLARFITSSEVLSRSVRAVYGGYFWMGRQSTVLGVNKPGRETAQG